MEKHHITKGLAVGIILLFVGTNIIPSSGQQIDRSPLPISRGDTLYVGGSGPGNYTKIQDAINNAHAGDTILVYNGIYNEIITVDIQLALRGIPSTTGEVPLIDSITIKADNCSLEWFRIHTHQDFGILVESNGNIIRNCSVLLALSDLKLRNSNHNLIDQNIFRGNNQGILLQNSSHNTIRNNLVDQHQFHTLCLVQGSSYNLVCNNDLSNSVYWDGISNEEDCCYNTYMNNTIHNNGEVGIHIKNSGLGLTIVNNSLMNNGVSFESSVPELLSYTIENNTMNAKQLYYLKNKNNIDISDAGQVILIQCSNCRILNQTISNVRTGFYGHGGGICLINSTQITIHGNSISGCTPVGIDVYSSNNINISSNILSENYGGISASHSNRNSIVDNIIQHGEDEGISLSRSSDNSIKRNTISDFKRALYLMFSSFNIVTSNQLLNQTYLFWNCVANQFVSNTMQGGIVLETDCSGTTLMYNTISQSNTGISLEYGMLIRIIGNNITNNGKGLQVGTTGFTLVKKNNFINNGIQASFEDTVWSSLFPDVWIQNYWDDFNGFLRYPIQGKYIINHFSWDPYNPIPPTIYPWTKYDWFPANEPYNLPGMR